MELNAKFTPTTENERSADVKLYQEAIGCLTYAMTSTRPELASVVGILSQFMTNPSESHWNGIKRVFRYLKGTMDSGLTFSGKSSVILSAYCDANYAGDDNDSRSISGYIFYVGGNCVSWVSRKQDCVVLSSTEAEYVALSEACKEAVWLRRLLKQLGFVQSSGTVICEDNKGAIELSRNPKFHKRSKHIRTRYHFSRECVNNGDVIIEFCPTSHMVADIFTKPLSKQKFIDFRKDICVSSVLLPE